MLAVHASSSKGNLFTISDGQTRLLLEAGLSVKQIRRAVGFQLADYAACFITHEHSDHSRGARGLIEMGLPCYMTPGTAGALGLNVARYIKPGEAVQVGTLAVSPIQTKHDAAQPVGYVIDAANGERIVFAIDTAYITMRVPKLTEIAIECNYSEELLRNSDMPERLRARIRASHMSLERVLAFLAANDLSRVRKITLLHLSRERADARAFIHAVSTATGIPTTI